MVTSKNIIFISNHKFSWLHWNKNYTHQQYATEFRECLLKEIILYWFHSFLSHSVSYRYFSFCISLTSLHLVICVQHQENLEYLQAHFCIQKESLPRLWRGSWCRVYSEEECSEEWCGKSVLESQANLNVFR